MKTGIVVVSHCHQLACEAVDFALGMVPGNNPPPIRIAAGVAVDDGWATGTDAAAISEALEELSGCDAIVVLMDIGSSVMSAQMALEFIDGDLARRVHLSPAPLLEGLLGAAVAAAGDAPVEEVLASAETLGDSKKHALSHTPDEPPAPDARDEQPPAQADASPRPADQPALHATLDDAPLQRTYRIRDPHGIHARPAAALAKAMRDLGARVEVSNPQRNKSNVSATSMIQLLMLDAMSGDTLHFQAWGDNACAALDRAAAVLDSFAKPHSAEDDDEADGAPQAAHADNDSADVEAPLFFDDNIAIGHAHWHRVSLGIERYRPCPDKDCERRRLSEAAATIKQFLQHRIDSASHSHPVQLALMGQYSVSSAAVMQAQLALLEDLPLWEPVISAVERGKDAPTAIGDGLDTIAQRFEQLTDPYLRQRAQDVRGVGQLLQLALVALSTGESFDEMISGILIENTGEEDSILFVERLSVLNASHIDPKKYAGVVTVEGSTTSHAVLVARGRGIPVVCAGEQARGVGEGQMVAIDARSNRFSFNLDDSSSLDEWRRRQQERMKKNILAMRDRSKPAVTLDGTPVTVLCNVTTMKDAALGTSNGAEGSGLVRTESLWASAATAPTIDEQCNVFVRLANHLGGPMTVRLWDGGADKPLPFIPQPPEINPFLGLRGFRLLQRYPYLVIDQLRAVIRAKRDFGVDISVMAPMISFPQEMEAARDLFEQAVKKEGTTVQDLDLPLGMMVEVPAAALLIEDFNDLSDFVSIGTNDLSQYMLAADRMNEDLWPKLPAEAAYPLDTPVVGAISWVASHSGNPVSVCGDMASNLNYVGDLIDAGITSLSVRPTMVPLIKQRVREHRQER